MGQEFKLRNRHKKKTPGLAKVEVTVHRIVTSTYVVKYIDFSQIGLVMRFSATVLSFCIYYIFTVVLKMKRKAYFITHTDEEGLWLDLA